MILPFVRLEGENCVPVMGFVACFDAKSRRHYKRKS